MRFDPSARRVLQDLKRLCSVMVSDEEQPSPSEFASLVNDILDPAVSAGPKKKFKPKGLFLGERRDSGNPSIFLPKYWLVTQPCSVPQVPVKLSWRRL